MFIMCVLVLFICMMICYSYNILVKLDNNIITCCYDRAKKDFCICCAHDTHALRTPSKRCIGIMFSLAL